MNYTQGMTIGLVLTVGSLACATSYPPKELLDARATYNRAQYGAASLPDRTDLLTAERALSAAEESFKKSGNTVGGTDLAYMAQRRAQIAEANAGTLQARKDERDTTAAMHASDAARAGDK